MCQHRLCSYTDCAHSTILIVREMAFCVKVLIYDMFKISFNQNNFFRNIRLQKWPKGGTGVWSYRVKDTHNPKNRNCF